MTEETPAPKHPRDMTPAERAAALRQIERDRVASIHSAEKAATDALTTAATEKGATIAAGVATGSTAPVPLQPKTGTGKHPRDMTHAERSAAIRALNSR